MKIGDKVQWQSHSKKTTFEGVVHSFYDSSKDEVVKIENAFYVYVINIEAIPSDKSNKQKSKFIEKDLIEKIK